MYLYGEASEHFVIWQCKIQGGKRRGIVSRWVGKVLCERTGRRFLAYPTPSEREHERAHRAAEHKRRGIPDRYAKDKRKFEAVR